MATKKKKFNLSSFVMNSPVSLWMILFVAIPFIYVVCISFMHKGTYGGVTFKFTTDNYKAIFDPLYLVTFGKSLLISLVTTIICILIFHSTKNRDKKSSIYVPCNDPIFSKFINKIICMD